MSIPLEVIADSEYVIDLGQRGGSEGGIILVQGNVQDIMEQKNSYTGQYLRKAIL